MPIFVHLTPAGQVQRIRRSGIKKGRQGVYCMPVLPNYYISHQWVRELKRSGQRTITAIYFYLPAEEPVLVGRYNKLHQSVGAGEASKILAQASDAEGYEVLLPRAVARAEIQRVRAVPQVVGWRFFPNSHLSQPCGCRWCLRGDIKAQRQWRRLQQADPTRTIRW
jgi:hypothetical protein